MKYRYERHTVFNIEYHFISGVVSKDHFHIYVSALPTMSQSEIMKSVKGRNELKSSLQ